MLACDVIDGDRLIVVKEPGIRCPTFFNMQLECKVRTEKSGAACVSCSACCSDDEASCKLEHAFHNLAIFCGLYDYRAETAPEGNTFDHDCVHCGPGRVDKFCIDQNEDHFRFSRSWRGMLCCDTCYKATEALRF